MKDRLRRFWHRLLHSGTRPGQVALAVFIGCVVGSTPFYGFHLLLCIFFAQIFGLNKLIVYGAANISFPPMGVAVAFGAVQLGERMLYGHWLQERYGEFKHRPLGAVAKEFFFAWTVGGIALGIALGLFFAGLVYLLLKLRRRPAAAGASPGAASLPDPMEVENAIETAISRAARRYLPRTWPWYSCYAVMKYGLDPCYEELLRKIPPAAAVTDLGTGMGMLPLALVLGESRRRVTGIEWDAKKVRIARRVTRALPAIKIIEGDLRDFPLSACEVITLVDVLHYFDAETQRGVMARCAGALTPGGMLLIREHDHTPSIRSWWTRRIEYHSVQLGWNRSPALHFRPISELVSELEMLGLRVERQTVSGPLHPGNVMLCARKAGP